MRAAKRPKKQVRGEGDMEGERGGGEGGVVLKVREIVAPSPAGEGDGQAEMRREWGSTRSREPGWRQHICQPPDWSRNTNA